MGTPAFVVDSVVVVEPVCADVQFAGQDICRNFHTGQLLQQFGRCSAPLRVFWGEQLCHRFQQWVGRQLPEFRFCTLKLPHAAFPVKLQCQLLIRLVTPHDVQ